MHIELRVQQASEDRNPMAISRMLNPSKDGESSREGSSRAVSDLLNGLSILPAPRAQQSTLNERDTYWRQHRLPLRAISPRSQYSSRRSSSFDYGHRNNRSPIHRYTQLRSPRQRSYHSTSPPASSSQSHAQDHHHAGSQRPPHSNKAYTQEQVDWMRFFHDDLGNAWKSLPVKFQEEFSTETRDSDQCFSSRYYRDNQVPEHNNWEPILGSDGRPRLMPAKVRQRQTPEGRALDIPYKLVEKHPERALTYSWVGRAHKEAARDILRMDALLDRGVIPESDQKSNEPCVNVLQKNGVGENLFETLKQRI
ncbi:hypothetical protein HYFRA_00012443 [Hymenoscyphus fraxineus]|uniref:Uncharacterized protein n=1 Tax=Hymenoscyphus fraxineus TaxID=746836 RepID=A0A9N9PYU7_9HELO|nr:hypothetical protein HYFRA_00012443 [Hymenoscyphus fraxineus]